MGKGTWMWLAAGLGYGAVNTGELLAAYPDGAEAIAEDLGSSRLDELLTQKQAKKLASTRPEDFSLRINHAEAAGIAALPFNDPLYPDMLRSINTPPPLLFVKGDVSLLNGQLSIGMVGARRPSAYGVEAARAIGRGVALGGAIIVSGLAAGLDAEAHKAALAVNGPTIACIAFGHDQCYPASNKKLLELIERYGAVVSEYPLGTTAEKPYFLQRNRLIAGLSHGLVVTEARKHSGTMSTVNFATDYGRDVFAVPGSIFSELSGGTNAMIREGAFLAGSASDVLAVYGIELAEEDPVVAASKQAAEGRPLPASSEGVPVWQQNLSRHAGREREAPASPATPLQRDSAWQQQTLAEALQGELGRGAQAGADAGRVSSRQAIDAFRKLQQMMPPATDSELDARNRQLDEMVAAVNDNVMISDDGLHRLPTPPPEPKSQPKVKTFRWDSVEHLSKAEMAKARGEQPPAPPAQPAAPRPARRSSRVEPVGRVGPVAPVMPVTRAAAVDELQPVPPKPTAGERVTAQRMAERERQTRQPAPGQGRPAPPQAGEPLAGRLRTMPRNEDTPAVVTDFSPAYTAAAGRPRPQAPANPGPPPTSAQAAAPMDMDPEDALPTAEDVLSANAQRAYAQLGANPITLAQLCERSGLTSGEAMAALTELELAGLSRQLAGRKFVIMQ